MDTCLYFVTGDATGSKCSTGTEAGCGSAASVWRKAASVGQCKETNKAGLRMSSEELTLLVSGIELSQSRRKDWYRKEIVEAGAEKPGD